MVDPIAPTHSARRSWVLGAAIALCLVPVAIAIALWARDVLMSPPVPRVYPLRGFAMQGIASGLAPIVACMFAAAATKFRLRVVRLAVAVFGGMLGSAVVWGLLIPGYWAILSTNLILSWVFFLLPATLYVAVARAPRWWVALPLAFWPMWIATGFAALY